MNRLVMAAVSAVLLAAGCGGQGGKDWKERLFPPPVATQLVRIESDKADERREALQAVAADYNARRLPSVIKVFCLVARNDKDPLVRSAAVRGLAVMEGEEVVTSLGAVATRDDSPYVRTDAARSLGQQKDAGAAAPLMEVLRADRMADVRVAAAEALRNFKDKAAAKALVTALDDSSLAVSRKAWESLRYMTGQNMPRKGEAWQDFFVNAGDPFALYGKPPAMPKGENQRPQFTRGPGEFIRDLFAADVNEAELN
ncbi:MAG: HEAT repeat domain-containing protein [Planctomycetota bacterium]|nr:HEAT repeat domain-containing protein [Planctomycetota bacterium]